MTPRRALGAAAVARPVRGGRTALQLVVAAATRPLLPLATYRLGRRRHQLWRPPADDGAGAAGDAIKFCDEIGGLFQCGQQFIECCCFNQDSSIMMLVIPKRTSNF